MKKINFKKVRIPCFALGKIVGLDREEKLNKAELYTLKKLEEQNGNLNSEEQSVLNFLKRQKKEAESSLSKTCISYLTDELFIYLTYGKRIRPGGESTIEASTRIIKGSLCELDAIKILSEHDGINYNKNRKKYKNKYIVGFPDINYKKRMGDRKIIDIKSSWDLYTFMNNLPRNLSLQNKHQTQGYIALTKADIGEVCHILTSAPEELIEKQVAKLRFKNVFATKNELDEAIELTRMSMRFDDIPIERRIIRFPVHRSEEDQQMLYDRVDLCRDWLVQYSKKHNDYFKNH